MSFTSQIKKELTQLPPTTGTLLALIRMNGSLSITKPHTLSITTENAATAQYIYKMLLELYQLQAELRIHQKRNLAKNRVYTVFIEQGVVELLEELSLADSLLLDNGIPDFVRIDENMQKDYLRGSFLSSGSVSDPETGSYSLEISSLYLEQVAGLADFCRQFGLRSKIIEHKKRQVLYLSRAEDILDFLTLIGAMQARFIYEDKKMLREMRGLANRQSNFESANITKTVAAAQEVISAIDFLLAHDKLPETLLEIAQVRLAHPEASLVELGQLLRPKLGKSGVAHRLRKIVDLAKKLRE